jgi:hypothetical protein
MKGSYIALSHRWWSSRHLITTKSNVTKHYQNISFGDLPKTFQDAITVCHFMKIRYLWIDSLCIVQDDPEDWGRESARMGHIYSNAFCTLATHAARHDTEGFLDSTLDFSHGSVLLGGQRGTHQVSVSLRNSFEWHTVWNSSLSTRGWIVQERLLSNQILHFAPSEIFWECESDILSLADNSGKIVSNMTQLPPPLLPRSPLEDKTPGIDTVWWYRTIQWYSRCQLTEEKDKLPAIACRVAQIQRTSTSKYFAGLWDYEIAKGLLWLAAEGVTLRRPQVRRAPSWSWASWDGPIRFLFLNKSTDSKPRVDFLTSPRLLDFPEREQEVDVSLETFFKRKARNELLPGSFPTDEPDSSIETDQFETIQISVQLIEVQAGTYEQIGESDLAGLYTWQGYRVLGKVEQPSRWVILDDETTINPCERVWFAIIGMINGVYVGLLVVKSSIGSDAYRRIGVGGYSLLKLCRNEPHSITLV